MNASDNVRNLFEAWAESLGHNLERHPTNKDFYYSRDVSALWVCFSTAYAMGYDDAERNLVAPLTLIQRTEGE